MIKAIRPRHIRKNTRCEVVKEIRFYDSLLRDAIEPHRIFRYKFRIKKLEARLSKLY